MPALPSGTVTFLFTDIEGSTRLWELYPAEMTTALAAHDALMRRVIERNDGCVFATAGDGFHAGFHTAASALTAAYEAQLGLATNPAPGPVNLKVPHGAAHRRRGGSRQRLLRSAAQSRGTTAQYGARRSGASLTRYARTGARCPTRGIEPAGLGRARDERLGSSGARVPTRRLGARFPLPAATDPRRASTQPTSSDHELRRAQFELQDLKELVRARPMVTLVGTGGAGKTRLALQAGARPGRRTRARRVARVARAP